MGKKDVPQCARAFKDNYWSRKRVENGVKIIEVANLLGCKRSTAGAYFTGLLMPPDRDIETLCDWFGVDFTRGKSEFNKAHKAYDAELKRKLCISARKPKVNTTKKEVEPKAVEQKEVAKVEKAETATNTNKVCDVMEICKLVYGRVGCEEYNQIYNTVKANGNIPLDLVYGKVDRITYELIRDIQNGKVAKVENFDNKWAI